MKRQLIKKNKNQILLKMNKYAKIYKIQIKKKTYKLLIDKAQEIYQCVIQNNQKINQLELSKIRKQLHNGGKDEKIVIGISRNHK